MMIYALEFAEIHLFTQGTAFLPVTRAAAATLNYLTIRPPIRSVLSGFAMTTLKLYGQKPRCWWCARQMHGAEHPFQVRFSKEDYSMQVCSGECEAAVTVAYAYIKKVWPVFLIGLVAALALIIGGGPRLSAVGVLLVGITLTIAPFATPQTTQMMGLKRSMLIARIGGVVLSVGALGILLVTTFWR
jgi:hypothetical protein